MRRAAVAFLLLAACDHADEAAPCEQIHPPLGDYQLSLQYQSGSCGPLDEVQTVFLAGEGVWFAFVPQLSQASSRCWMIKPPTSACTSEFESRCVYQTGQASVWRGSISWNEPATRGDGRAYLEVRNEDGTVACSAFYDFAYERRGTG
jgi:hypothetical protein